MRRLVYLIIVFVVISTTSAQEESLFVGPLVAAVPAAQDKIILYDLGSGTQRELSFDTGWHNVWGFSPDGCRVLLTLTDESGLGRAYTARLDGEELTELVQYPELPKELWGVWEPQWSPDGSKIAFKMLRDGFEGKEKRQYHIAWIPSEGGELTFYSRTGHEHTPQWSPDSKWLAYVSYTERPEGADIFSTAEPTEEAPQTQPVMLNEADIWITSADGETRYPLTNFTVGSVSMPRWSPDSTYVGFVYSPSSSNDTQWVIANQQGARPSQLTYFWNLALDLTWLPDSSAMIGVLRDFREVPDNRLWQLPLVGNADNNGTIYLDNPNYTFPDYPRFNAEGSMVALRTNYGMAVLETETMDEILLDTINVGNTPPVWSPIGFQGEAECKNL